MAQSTGRQALDILACALEVAPDEREAFLGRECGEDETLMREVRSLLASSDSAPADFLSPPTCPPDGGSRLSEGALDDALIGRTIGRYHITSVIASGGMGTVYEARQERPQRIVALKVLRPGLLSQSAARRFEHEAEILARLRHPNIAQIFEAGLHRDPATGQDLSYFAMEHVPGADPITVYATEAGLDIKAKLTLFLEVCDGVQHGHQRGIIHRDLKPGNILVDDEGCVKVIDFGVARTTDSDIAITTMHTEVGQLIGTLQYMCPEQCAADPLEIDTRCDVYALGAVLYELLAGRLPYDVSHMTLLAASRVICEQPAERPSRFTRSLAGDLDAIILKALAKRREDRYASVSELTSDLRAFMRGEPIKARPPTRWQRTTAWAMRHPKATAVLTSLIIVAGIVGGSWAVIAKTLHDFDRQPDRMVFDAKARGEAILLSRSGRMMKRWGSPAGNSLAFATLYAAPGSTPDAAYAIVGGFHFGDLTHLNGLMASNGVNVYNVTDGEVGILWADFVRDEDLPSSLKAKDHVDFAASSFGVQLCWLLDVFPSRAGKELVVMFGHDRSRRMLVIYDIGTGERLYRVWHDGFIESVACLPEPGLLLMIAEDARTYLKVKGYAEKETCPPGSERAARYPMMMVALKPEIGVLEPEFIALTEGMDGVRPVWIRWWTPLWVQDVVRLRFASERAVSDAGTQAPCRVTYIGSGVAFGLAVDQDGREVQDSRMLGDTYHLYRGDGPEHDIFRLCDRLPLPGEEVPPGKCPP